MRRHAKASSSGSNERKPSGRGSRTPSGRLRLTILFATVAAFLLVPAAQAAANGTAFVELAGTGSGEVSSVGGYFGLWEGSPPIECSGPPATGTCETELEESEEEPGIEAIGLHATADPGSEFAGWVVLEGEHSGCAAAGSCIPYQETGEGDAEVIAIFEPAQEFTLTVSKTGTGSGTVTSSPAGINCGSECSAEYESGTKVTLTATAAGGSTFTGWSGSCINLVGPCEVTMSKARSVTASFTKEGPTNKRLLTLTKSPSPSAGTGQGTVKSKPKGINCASACSGAEASLYKNTTVVLTEKPTGETSTFVEWNGCDSETEGKCVVTMSEAKSVEAVFAGTSKAIPNPQALTVAKVDNGFETGQGTVKSKPGGIACENDCTETAALFAGTLTEPKPKAATKVVLTQTKAPGSVFSGWSGCDEEVEGACVVNMSEAKAVTAEFTALPKNTLTLTKSPSPSAGTGVGTVTSKPKGIKCATACAEEQASLPEDATVVLKAKAATGSTLEGWEGCESTTVISATEGTCTVSMATAQEVSAEFGGTSKAILNPQALTLAKAGSGYGTVKSKPGGIACEADCTASTALYQGTLTEPKPKAAATVTLTAISAPGSQTVVWSGCDEEVEGACVVSMSEAKEVTATFNELE